MIDDLDEPEGATPLDPDEMEGLRFAHITTRDELNHLEQANIDEGLSWLDKQGGGDLLTDHFARKLHKKMFGQVWTWAGTYRQTEKNIGIDPVQIVVQLRYLMDDVQYWVDNNTYGPIEAAVRFHHKLVYIHPFPNGNGRFARFMADALLEKLYDEDAIDWYGGYNLQEMNERRLDYIDALRAADEGNYEPLLDFVGE
ncbi:MAG: mobile mystery protein B [Gammaproteobacteria bacterium]|nr:mobile mystery protein B [Gammaproteobacteria bacterium]